MTLQPSLLLLRSDDSQDPRLLDRGDPVAYSSTSRSCPRPLSPLGLPIRPPPPPLPIYHSRLFAQYNRPRNITDNPPRFPRAIPRHLSGRNGRLLHGSHRHLLVRHELERAHAKKHWHCLYDWFWEYGWDRGDLLLPGQGCPVIPFGLFDMHGSGVRWSTGCCAVCRTSDPGEQRRAEKRRKRIGGKIVLVMERLWRHLRLCEHSTSPSGVLFRRLVKLGVCSCISSSFEVGKVPYGGTTSNFVALARKAS